MRAGEYAVDRKVGLERVKGYRVEERKKIVNVFFGGEGGRNGKS
jgi:hypothetical protein